MEIITKYSDYSIHPIESFITLLKSELSLRDISGLTNNQITKMPITKEHPLVQMISQTLNSRTDTIDTSGLIPGIGITPGNPDDDAKTHGLGVQYSLLDDTWIEEVQKIKLISERDRAIQGILSNSQIDLIIHAYNQDLPVKCLQHKYRQKEETNISLWTESADMDMILSNLMDSVLHEIISGIPGENKDIKNMQMTTVKGLTNFNFGRVLYGTEYSITFLNTKNNYTIFTEEALTEYAENITTIISGETTDE